VLAGENFSKFSAPIGQLQSHGTRLLTRGAALAEEPNVYDPLAAAFESHYQSLRRFAYARSGPDLADDVASEVFARAVALWPSFDPDRGSLPAWLFGIAANICREHDRARRRRTAAIARFGATASTAPDSQSIEDADLVMSALLKLRAPIREALLLVAGFELSYAEAARALGIPVGTVASRVAYGRRRLAHLRGADQLPIAKRRLP
jgi:RNA polymerase sigma-70 factor (ECF subfamily)